MESSDDFVGAGPNCSLLTEVGGLTFSSRFDSGNLVKAVFEANEYRLWVGPDCAGTPHETSYTAWFHFSVQGAKKGQTVTLVIMNSNPLKGLYGSDMRPVYRCRASKHKWERLPNPVRAKTQGDVMRLSFRFRFDEADDSAFFAFCYPWAYDECTAQLDALDAQLAGLVPHSNIYYHRELLARSVEGRRIDVLTISSREGMSAEPERGLDDPHVFPERDPDNIGGPRSFELNKKVIFVSARVHPGETPSSFVFNGLLHLLLREDDPWARQLRRQFVFKLVPMLNPDGVARGHYRLDTQGLNLNRHYIEPCPTRHPAIYAVRALLLKYHAMGSLLVYLDLHAHAAKKGCFFYGNQLERNDLDRQVATQLFAKVAARHSHHLEYAQCVFTEKNMKRRDKRDRDLSKEGAGRVALYRATGLTHLYTLECNYNEGTRVTASLKTAAAFTTSTRRSTPPSLLERPPRSSAYTSACWEEVGVALGVTLLDMAGTNPLPLPPPATPTPPPPSLLRRRTTPAERLEAAAEASGDINDMFRLLRDQILSTGNFDDCLTATSWADMNGEWLWTGPLLPPDRPPPFAGPSPPANPSISTPRDESRPGPSSSPSSCRASESESESGSGNNNPSAPPLTPARHRRSLTTDTWRLRQEARAMGLRRVLQTHTALAADPPPQYKMASPPTQVKEREKPNTPRQLWTVTTYANNPRSLTNAAGEAKPAVPTGNKAPTAPAPGSRGRSMSLINSGARSLRINKTGEGNSTELQLKAPLRGTSGVMSTLEI